MNQKADYAIYNLFPAKGVEYLPGVNFYRHWKKREDYAEPVLIYQPLGNIWVAIEWAALRLGILTLAKMISIAEGHHLSRPPVITEAIKQLGTRYSPEFICFPYKVILGYLLFAGRRFEKLRGQSLYPLFLSHEGPLCRERAYGRLQESKLSELYQQEFQKQDFDFYIAKESLAGLLELIALFQKISGKSFLAVVSIINAAIKRLDIVEKFEDEVRHSQSLGVDFRAAEKILEEMKEAIVQDEISPSRVLKQAQEKLGKLHKPRSEAKVIYITGEIFHIEEAGSCSGDVLREIARRGFYPKKRVGLGHYTPRFQLTISRFARFILAYYGIPVRHKMKE
ncbi:MAG: hypothetical protein Q7S82_04045, partial [bacterium]|nr:hypothetical protein [bacterium]